MRILLPPRDMRPLMERERSFPASRTNQPVQNSLCFAIRAQTRRGRGAFMLGSSIGNSKRYMALPQTIGGSRQEPGSAGCSSAPPKHLRTDAEQTLLSVPSKLRVSVGCPRILCALVVGLLSSRSPCRAPAGRAILSNRMATLSGPVGVTRRYMIRT